MDNDGESSDYENVFESSDTEYYSDSSVSHGFSSESEIDFHDWPYDIATNPVTQAPDLGKSTQTPWFQVNEAENGHLDFQFDSSVSVTKHIQNYELTSFICRIDFFYFIHHIYGT